MAQVQLNPGAIQNRNPYDVYQEALRQNMINSGMNPDSIQGQQIMQAQMQGGPGMGAVLGNMAVGQGVKSGIGAAMGSGATAVGSGASGVGVGAGLSGVAGVAEPTMMGAGLTAAEVPTSISNFAGSATPYIGGLGVALGGYNALQGIKKGKPLQAGLGAAGAGLGLNAMNVALGPWGWGAMVAAPMLMSLLGGHKSTRDVTGGHTKDLQGMGAGDSRWQNYVNAMRGQYESAPTDPSKPFAGKYGSWDEYKKGGLEAGDLTGVYGNMKAFGPDWASKSFDQQKAVTQALINANLYDSKKGDVVITDEGRAKTIAADTLKNLLSTSTRKDSPGFKNGKRV